MALRELWAVIMMPSAFLFGASDSYEYPDAIIKEYTSSIIRSTVWAGSKVLKKGWFSIGLSP